MAAVNVSEIITGLAEFGTDLGTFITNVIPGVVTLIIVLAIAGGLAALFQNIFGKLKL